MAVKTTYSHARENLATLWDEVEDSREAAIIQRRGHDDMALIPADELASLRETAYLLRSPANAARLLAALTRARRGRTKSIDLAALRRDLGVAPCAREPGPHDARCSRTSAGRTFAIGWIRTARWPSGSSTSWTRSSVTPSLESASRNI